MDDRRWRIFGSVTLAVAVVSGLAVGFLGGPQPMAIEQIDAALTLSDSTVAGTSSARVVVHVAGAVVRPGLVSLPPDSRVADAIAAAGGMTGEGLETGINLAAPVSDGAQVIVPSVADRATPPGDGLVDVNQAGVVDLESLAGVGPVLAERIVAYREANGPFATVEDMLDVPGIGEAKLAAMRDQLAVP